MPSDKAMVSATKIMNLIIYIGITGTILFGILKIIWPLVFGPPDYLYFIIPLVLYAAFYNIKKSRNFYNKMENLN